MRQRLSFVTLGNEPSAVESQYKYNTYNCLVKTIMYSYNMCIEMVRYACKEIFNYKCCITYCQYSEFAVVRYEKQIFDCC